MKRSPYFARRSTIESKYMCSQNVKPVLLANPAPRGGARAKPRKLEKAVARGGLLRHRAHNTFDDLSKLGRVGW